MQPSRSAGHQPLSGMNSFLLSRNESRWRTDFPRPKPLVSPSPRNPLRGEETKNLEKPAGQFTPHFFVSLFIYGVFRTTSTNEGTYKVLCACVALTEGRAARKERLTPRTAASPILDAFGESLARHYPSV
ncbi:hypothetical protein M441DRAFT_352229 [Trichoderma asperellum CBS 433.97]|uniref:Uncharacterized protein n=1 Tax=Trichoderma asperellum (strain ATCC 204424 / CBS 433.97 / NBRC 101777) TaxID=1042311 RepID=A0A2T3ZIG9_TRIA4|nr:hypothetical protein M441DRAFT_352229 [Trichoderma asperellum CBS 433.97]PTB44608.1 hypothetical protein M441DRAFT_352229 [Trichoderma asperellum CBS 433.97]